MESFQFPMPRCATEAVDSFREVMNRRKPRTKSSSHEMSINFEVNSKENVEKINEETS